MIRLAELDPNEIPRPPHAARAPYGTPEWWLERFLAEDQRLMGRYCCPDAAAHKKQSCSRHGRADPDEVYRAHGIPASAIPAAAQRITTADAARYLS